MQKLIQQLNNDITIADEMVRTLKANLRKLHNAIQRSDDVDCSLIECRQKIGSAITNLAGQVAGVLKIARQLQEMPKTELSEESMSILLHIAYDAYSDDMTELENEWQRQRVIQAALEIAEVRRTRAKIAEAAGNESETNRLELLAAGAENCAESFKDWPIEGWLDDDDLVEEDIADDYLGNDLEGDCRADCGHVSMRHLIEFGCPECEEDQADLCA